MSSITTSANAIVQVNKALQTILQQYLNPEESAGVDIRFDLPELGSMQPSPTVSVFLYDVHEDLQLRQSEPARLNASAGHLRAGWINLSCNYLITYWEAQSAGSDGNGPDSRPDNQAIQVMTRTLQALLNNRELSGIAGAYTRIIPPQENLNSLGNFWQALGNRPRLSLMYSVTVPILLDNSVPQTLVKTVSSEFIQTAAVDNKALNRQLWQTLCKQMGVGAQEKLARVVLECLPAAGAEDQHTAVTINMTVAGIVDKTYQASLETHLSQWREGKDAVSEINGRDIYVENIDSEALVFI
ncbi:DUF4255 domain-containing protein [Serratia sp. 2723]|uniref:DUF4255 domain-containing protein n=1 Tax=unclassified Serratia (in: enterobacteria) TaxID=2647522 RepID=UPI003D1D7C11